MYAHFLTITVHRAKTAPQRIRHSVFGFAREYAKIYSQDVPVMVQYLCLSYLFMKEEFEIHNTTKLRFDDTRYPTNTPWRMAMGKVRIGPENHNEEHKWIFTLLEVDDLVSFDFEIGILSMIKNRSADLPQEFQARFNSHHLTIERYPDSVLCLNERTLASLMTDCSGGFPALPPRKVIRLEKAETIEMILNGHSRKLIFRFPGFHGYDSFDTHVSFKNMEFQMFVAFTQCKIQIDLTEYSCKVIEDGIVIN